ncbi:hypothetical protein [Sphingobium yanoikuyae]|uniref:hypothetical protein n=1 Tax=Sphingobium yanoikuyae TaxID=13690 RepID=UPI0035C77824
MTDTVKPAPDGVVISRELLAFLCGDGPLDGHYFGEKPEHERGNFWWRKALRAAEQAALEQAGEPVDVALLDRAELAWQRFFYPAADCFTGPVGDKVPSVDLEVADCLRLVLAAVGRLVVTPEADVSAPLPTLQRLGQEFDAGEAEPIAWMWDYRVRYRDDGNDWSIGTVGRKKPPADNSDYRNVVPLYAHPPKSRVAAETVGLRAVEGANSHVFDLRILIGDSDDEKAECIAFANEPWAGRIIAALATRSQPDPQSRANEVEERKFYLSDWTISQLLEARSDGLVTDDGEAWRYRYTHKDAKGKYDLLYRPQSRGQAFDGEGEAVGLRLVHRAARELIEAYDDPDGPAIVKLNALRAALSSAKRGEG